MPLIRSAVIAARCCAWVPLLTAVVALAGAAGAAAAQSASIQGIVISEESGEPVEGVSVLLEAGGRRIHGALTDRNGFYQIGGIEAGTYTLRGRHIGHLPHVQDVRFAVADRIVANFRLEETAVPLEEVVVSGERGATVRDLGRQRVTPADIRTVPVPAGSGDLATYLQTLPGVTTTGDRGGQLFVRGGTPAENQVLVDGIPIYQPFHILGFFSIFPEDLVSSVDFYAGGFGARYNGRTSSVLDVALREGDRNNLRSVGSVSPFLAEALVEGPLGAGVSLLASARRSLVAETSGVLLGDKQRLSLDSQLLKLSVTAGEDQRCSALVIRTSDRGRLDAEESDSHVGWKNFLSGGRCVLQFDRFLRLLEVTFSASSLDNSAVSRGSSRFRSKIWRMQHELHATTMIRSIPLRAGYHAYFGYTDYDLVELFGIQSASDGVDGLGGYAELELPVGSRIELRPGMVLTAVPRLGVEPRLRASWEPFGRPSEKVQGALGLYRQYIVGTSDLRDVSSVFVAWNGVPQERPLEALHAILGWQQSFRGGLGLSMEGYYKRLSEIPVPTWRATAQFTTRLSRAEGEVYGADARVALSRPHFYGYVGYGYASTVYEATSEAFGTWFGEPVQRYHPPHDRRHQVNAVTSLDFGDYRAAARWQLGTGLPFTRPLGFDEAFDYTMDFHDVTEQVGTTRLVLDKPFTARLPTTHRLDLSVEKDFEVSAGTLTAQVGVINAYDRRNMFFYDLYSGRRVDQLPLAPYASVMLRSRP